MAATISFDSDQLRAFSVYSYDMFIIGQAEIVAQALGLPQAQAGKVAERMMAKAKTFGFETKVQLARFVEITVIRLGLADPEQIPGPALDILSAFDVDKYERLDRYQIWAERLLG